MSAARRTAAAAAVTALALTAACSGSSTGGGTTGTSGASGPTGLSGSAASSVPAASTSASVSSVAAASTSASGSTSTAQPAAPGRLTASQVQAAALTAGQVGGGFTRTTPQGSGPLPCTPAAPPLDQQVRPGEQARVTLGALGDKVELDEIVTSYADTATSTAALTAFEKGLNCSSGTLSLGGQPAAVHITGPSDLTSTLTTKVDRAEGWTLTASGGDISLIYARIGTETVSLIFSAAAGTDTSTLPSSKTITELALTKVKDAG